MRKNRSSIKRRAKRMNKPKANGNPIPLHERKVKKSLQNAGGFYDGMPGVSIDDAGNRRIINFVVTPEGDSNAYIFANPFIVKKAVQQSFKHREIRSLIISAVVDHTFKTRFNPLYWMIRIAFRFKKWSAGQKVKRRNRKFEKDGETQIHQDT